YKELITARDRIDITSLMPIDGRFLSTLRAALHKLDADSTKAITVRIQYGWVTLSAFRGLLQEIVGPRRDGKGNNAALSGGHIKVYLGYVLKGAASWNHAKIVAVDGRQALVAGYNMAENDYLNKSPVHDLGILVEGRAARDAHEFIDRLWEITRLHFS